MNRGLRLLIVGIEAVIVLAVIYFEPSYCVRGILWREAFFDGKPTSYWRDELNQWEVTKEYSISWLGYSETVYHRNPTRIEAFRERWFPAAQIEPIPDADLDLLLKALLAQTTARRNGPPLLRGGDDAIPVLQALLEDPSPRIRLFAQIGLGMNPKIPGDE
jgi:hypothetical protein